MMRKSTLNKRFGRVVMMAGALLLCASPLYANEGITVQGVGRVEVLPDTVVMAGTVSGDAELAADAAVKFNDNKRRAVDAIEALGIEGLSIEGQGFMVSSAGASEQMQRRIMMGQMPEVSAAQVRISEDLKVTISGVDAMSVETLSETITNLIDAGNDAGVTLGTAVTNIIELQIRGNQPQPLAVFQLSDPSSAMGEAYKAAMEDARANARRLADLAGVKLGKVASVTQTQAPDEDGGGTARSMAAMIYGMAMSSDDDQATSNTFTKVPVVVSLRVRFEIE